MVMRSTERQVANKLSLHLTGIASDLLGAQTLSALLLSKGWREVLRQDNGLLKKKTGGGAPALQVQMTVLRFGVQHNGVKWSPCETM